jgi:hypothetical protein
MPTTIEALIKECRDLSRNALYTSTALFLWLRFLRWVRVAFIAVPLVLGAIAGVRLLSESEAVGIRFGLAIATLIAGVLPTIFSALKFDDHIRDTTALAAEYKNLQDRFRQAADIYSTKPMPEFEAEFKKLMERQEAARKSSYTAPEYFFRQAQKKIQRGDYDPDPQPVTPQAGATNA